MYKLRVVPEEEWEILKKYMDSNSIFIRESDLKTLFTPEEQAKLQAPGAYDNYNDECEPMVSFELILEHDSYAALHVLGEEE